MKEISIFKGRVTGAFTALVAALLVLVCMPVSCSSGDDGPSEAKTVTVSYETLLGNQPAQITLTMGKELTSAELPQLSAEGFIFLGWYLRNETPDGVFETKIQPGYKVNANLTLTAKWQKLTYFITYESEKGDYSKTVTVAPNSVIDESLLAAPDVTVEGYDFAGWYIGTIQVLPGSLTVGEDGVVLTAKWQLAKIKLSYFTDYGTAPEAVTLDYGSVIEETHLTPISAAQCTFKGWYLNDQPATAGTVLTKDTTLTAHWTVDGCSVVYRSEHGTVPKGLILTEGTVLGEEYLEPMSEDGYNFLGWYIGVNKVEPGTITVTGAGITLTAQWEVIQCKITYTTDLSSAPAPRTVNWGTLLNSEQLPELSCTGWTFKGWLFNGEPVSENYKVTGSITLTADWEKMKCRIIYESAHGSYVPEEAVLEYGSRLPSSMLPELSDNEGKWEFKGWYLKNAVNGEPLEGGTYTVEGHVTLTAKWECKTASTGMNVELISSNELYVYWNQNWSEDRHCYVYEFIGEDNYSSYKWLIDGNTKSGWNSNTVVLYGDEYARGMYTIMAVATDSDGNRRSYTAQVTIN